MIKLAEVEPDAEALDSYRAEAEMAARHNTFMDMGGALTRHMNLIREDVLPALKLFIPFLNTHMNLMKRAAEMVPVVGLGFEWTYRTDPKFVADSPGHRSADIVAKQLEGMMFVWLVMMVMDDDEIVGAAPTEPSKMAHFYNSGKVPYSVKFGDKYYSFEYMDPFNVPFSILADLKTLMREGTDMSPEEFSQQLMAAATAFGSRLLEPAFLQRFTDYANIKSEENKLKAFGRSVESVIIPYNGMWRWLKKQVNIMEHEGKFVPQEEAGPLMAQVFPLTTDILEMFEGEPLVQEYDKLNVWGEQMVISEHDYWKLWAYTSKQRTISDDPAELIFDDMQYYPGLPNKQVTIGRQQYDLSMDIYQQFLMGYGKEGKDAVRRLATSQGFRSMPKVRQAAVIEETLQKIRDRHRKKAIAAQVRAGLPSPVGG
jgi:hypothetical protein